MSEKTLEELVNESGQLTSINVLGINIKKQEKIEEYLKNIAQTKNMDSSKFQTAIKDYGSDCIITIFYNDKYYSQINYSELKDKKS